MFIGYKPELSEPYPFIYWPCNSGSIQSISLKVGLGPTHLQNVDAIKRIGIQIQIELELCLFFFLWNGIFVNVHSGNLYKYKAFPLVRQFYFGSNFVIRPIVLNILGQTKPLRKCTRPAYSIIRPEIEPMGPKSKPKSSLMRAGIKLAQP